MKENGGFMSEFNNNDVNTILKKLEEIEKEVSEMKISLEKTSGQSKGNYELLKLEIEHMKSEQKLREDKIIAETTLVNNEVQRNKDSIARLYDKDREHDNISTKISILFIAMGIMAPAIVYAVVQGVLIYGKVKGF